MKTQIDILSLEVDIIELRTRYIELSTRYIACTGMIASSTTFRPHPGRIIRDLFRLYGIVREH